MGAVKNLIVRVGADLSALEKEMKSAQKKLKKYGNELTSVGKTLTLGITVPLVSIGAVGIKTASDLQEVQNVVDTAFGDSAGKVDEWAKTTLEAYGLTQLEAKQYAGTMRAMTDSMGVSSDEADTMSMKLAELAGDMSSFYNLEHDEVWDKIRSGISGETEPLKQLGINMSVANLEAYALASGIEKTYNEMTEAEKATLRYNYLLDATENAQGDFSKTNDSFANSLRTVKGMFEETAGELMNRTMPYLEALLKKVQEGIRWFDGLSESQKDLIVKVGLVAAVIGPLLTVFGTLATSISSILGLLSGVGGLSAVFAALTGPAGIIMLVIGALVLLVANWDKVTGAIQAAIDKVKAWNRQTIADKYAKAGITGAGGGSGTGGRAFASGTTYAPGGLSLVGERGPELVDIPRGSRVYTNDETRTMLGGVTVTGNTFIIRGEQDITKTARALYQEMQKQGRASGVMA